MILLRALVRLVSFLLLLVLCLAGLALAVMVIDPSAVSGRLGLASLRDSVGSWFDALAAPGDTAVLSALGGLAAMVLGLGLLAGLLVPRRERLVTLSEGEHGSLTARRRPLAQVAGALAEQTRGVTAAKVKVSPRRRGGGRLRVRAARPKPAPAGEVEQSISRELEELTTSFKLKPAIQTHAGERGSRVQ